MSPVSDAASAAGTATERILHDTLHGTHRGVVDALGLTASMASGAHAPVPTISILAGEDGQASSRRTSTPPMLRSAGIGSGREPLR